MRLGLRSAPSPTLILTLTLTLARYFNYTPDAGGLGRETLRRVVFKDGRLALTRTLPLTLVLTLTLILTLAVTQP